MLDDLWAKVELIPGWFNRDEADMLLELTDGPWCEVGCWMGRSTVILAETAYPGWAVDWFQGSPEHPDGIDTHAEFTENLAGYDNVTIVDGRFEEVAGAVPDGLRLLHLDADHSYEMTQLAFELYVPKVVVGGHVSFHDAIGGGWQGVEKFVGTLRPDDWQRLPARNLSVAFKRLR